MTKQRTTPELPNAFQNLFFVATFFKKAFPRLVLHINAGPQNDMFNFLRMPFLLRIKAIMAYSAIIAIKMINPSIGDIISVDEYVTVY
jgi:hypothetical protein